MKQVLIAITFILCSGGHANHHQIGDPSNRAGIVKPRLVNGDSSRRKCLEDEEVEARYAEVREAVARGEATEQDAVRKVEWIKKNVCPESQGKAWDDVEDDRAHLDGLSGKGCEHFGIIVHDRIPPVIEKDGHIFTFDPESRSYRAIGFRPHTE